MARPKGTGTVRPLIEPLLSAPITPYELAILTGQHRKRATNQLLRGKEEGWVKRLSKGVYISASHKPLPVALNWKRA